MKIVGLSFARMTDFIASLEQFNEFIMEQSYVLFDECEKSGFGVKLADRLKALMTEAMMQRKGKNDKDQWLFTFQHCVFLSNHDQIVKIEQGDRRYCLFKASDCRARDTAYFKRLGAAIKDSGLVQQFVNFLGSIDLSNWNPEDFPKTPEREELVVVSPLERFLTDMAYPHETMVQQTMFEDWKKWCEDANVRKGTSWSFGKDIRALLELDGHTHNSPRYKLGKFKFP